MAKRQDLPGLIDPHPQELAPRIPFPCKSGRQLQRRRRHGMAALTAQDERPHQHQEGNKGRHRITWQPDESGMADTAKGERLARLDGALQQVEESLGLNRRFQVILLAHRDATRGQDQVMILRGAAQGCPRGVQGIGNDAEIGDFAAVLGQQTQKLVAV